MACSEILQRLLSAYQYDVRGRLHMNVWHELHQKRIDMTMQLFGSTGEAASQLLDHAVD
jgi:hypothetical protein